MVDQVALVGQHKVNRPSRWARLDAGMAEVDWLVSFMIAVSTHNRFQELGQGVEVLGRLVTANWIRTVSWPIVFLCSLPW